MPQSSGVAEGAQQGLFLTLLHEILSKTRSLRAPYHL